MITTQQLFTNITIFDCDRRIKTLKDYRALVVEVFDEENRRKDRSAEERHALRQRINQELKSVEEFVILTDVPIDTHVKLPFHTSYFSQPIFGSLFNKDVGPIVWRDAIDNLDQAIGRYKAYRGKSILNTVSPFFWKRRFADWITRESLGPFGVEEDTKTFSVTAWIWNRAVELATIYGGLATYTGSSTLGY